MECKKKSKLINSEQPMFHIDNENGIDITDDFEHYDIDDVVYLGSNS